MSVVLGVDVGGSTTKIVALDESGEIRGFLQVRAGDQLTSLFGAVGNLLYSLGLSLKDVRKIVLTGVGAARVDGELYGIPTEKVAEFEAIGRGGLLLSNEKEAMIISMGTGTAFVHAGADGSAKHVGGSAIGGGTLMGLAYTLLEVRDMDAILNLASQGDLANVDLTIRDHHLRRNSFAAARCNGGQFRQREKHSQQRGSRLGADQHGYSKCRRTGRICRERLRYANDRRYRNAGYYSAGQRNFGCGRQFVWPAVYCAGKRRFCNGARRGNTCIIN